MNASVIGLTIVVGLCGIAYSLSSHDPESVSYVADDDRTAELETRIATLEQQLDHLQKSHDTAFNADSRLFETINIGFTQIELRMAKVEKWSKDYMAYHSKVREFLINGLAHAKVSRLNLGRQTLALADQQTRAAVMLKLLLSDDPEFTAFTNELESDTQATAKEIQRLLDEDKAYPGNNNENTILNTTSD